MDLETSIWRQNRMILRLAKEVIATTAGKDSNLVYSPALINIILSFIAAGYPGTTRDKILKLLKAPSSEELNAVSSEILTKVLADATANGGPTISAANGLWIDKSFPVEQSFKDIVENSYKAAFNQVDFRTKVNEVTEEINLWIEKETKGLITDLLAPRSVPPLTDLIFANALFFNVKWLQQFDPSLTEDSDFHRLDGTKVRVPFMSGDFYLNRVEVYEGFKVLELSYRYLSYAIDKRSFSMKFYLPDEKDGLPAMLERLASTRGIMNGNEDIPSHKAALREVKIPRFKFDFDFDATEALKGLGVEVPLGKIVHKSCIEVDEVGRSKAAAAAAIGGIGGCLPPEEKCEFVADHPFLFLVKEYKSNLVLFLGQVVDPSLH